MLWETLWLTGEDSNQRCYLERVVTFERVCRRSEKQTGVEGFVGLWREAGLLKHSGVCVCISERGLTVLELSTGLLVLLLLLLSVALDSVWRKRLLRCWRAALAREMVAGCIPAVHEKRFPLSKLDTRETARSQSWEEARRRVSARRGQRSRQTEQTTSSCWFGFS